MKKITISISLITALAFFAGACKPKPNPADATAKKERVTPTFVKASSPGVSVTGGFLTLYNSTESELSLDSANCQFAGVTELHDMIQEDDKMKMRKIEKIMIPPKSEVELKPGSLHIMLIDLEKELKEGDEVTCTLNFSDGEKIEAKFPVKKLDMTQMKIHESHD